MSDEPPKPKPDADVSVSKAPAFVKTLLARKDVTIPIATAFDAVEAVILEAQRNITRDQRIPRREMPAAIDSISHLLDHLRLFKAQGEIDLKNRRTQ